MGQLKINSVFMLKKGVLDIVRKQKQIKRKKEIKGNQNTLTKYTFLK